MRSTALFYFSHNILFPVNAWHREFFFVTYKSCIPPLLTHVVLMQHDNLGVFRTAPETCRSMRRCGSLHLSLVIDVTQCQVMLPLAPCLCPSSLLSRKNTVIGCRVLAKCPGDVLYTLGDLRWRTGFLPAWSTRRRRALCLLLSMVDGQHSL